MTNKVIDTYPQETNDFLPFEDLGISGVAITEEEDVEYAVSGEFSRPEEWLPAENSDIGVGFTLDGPSLGPGVWRVHVRVTGDSIAPVRLMGYFRLT